MIPLGVLGSARVAPAAGGAITDTFTRADGPLHGSSTETGGATWEVIDGTWSIVSGRVGLTAGGGVGHRNAVVDVGASNMHVEAHFASSPDTYRRIIGRWVDYGNQYFYEVDTGNGALYVGRRIAGVQTWLWNGGTVQYDLRYGLTLVESGGATNITITKNGVTQWSGTDSAVGRPQGTRAGIGQAIHPYTRIDDFTAEAL